MKKAPIYRCLFICEIFQTNNRGFFIGERYKKKNLPKNREDPNQKPLTIKPYPMKIQG